MPEPTTPAARRGRPPGHQLVDVLSAATAVIDDGGLPALSMRAVGDRLGLTPMALYRYVANKDELLDLLTARLLEPVLHNALAATAAMPALHAIADTMYAVLREHPEAAPLLARPASTPAMETAGRHCVELLLAAGARPAEAFEMVRSVVAQVIGESVTSHGNPGTFGTRFLLAGIQARLTVPHPSPDAHPEADGP